MNFGRQKEHIVLRLQSTVIIDTPKFFLFDARTDSITDEVDSIILHQTHELGGKIETRYVDVVGCRAW